MELKDFYKKLAALKLPKSNVTHNPDFWGEFRWTWEKKSGFAGEKVIARVLANAEANGFVDECLNIVDHPDGSWTGKSHVLVNQDKSVKIYTTKFYGETQAYNRYTISIVLTKNQ